MNRKMKRARISTKGMKDRRVVRCDYARAERDGTLLAVYAFMHTTKGFRVLTQFQKLKGRHLLA